MTEEGEVDRTPLTRDQYRSKAVDLAKAQLENEPWFRGVNVTHLDEYYEDEYPVEEAADQVALDTEFWDGGWWNQSNDND